MTILERLEFLKIVIYVDYYFDFFVIDYQLPKTHKINKLAVINNRGNKKKKGKERKEWKRKEKKRKKMKECHFPSLGFISRLSSMAHFSLSPLFLHAVKLFANRSTSLISQKWRKWIYWWLKLFESFVIFFILFYSMSNMKRFEGSGVWVRSFCLSISSMLSRSMWWNHRLELQVKKLLNS